MQTKLQVPVCFVLFLWECPCGSSDKCVILCALCLLVYEVLLVGFLVVVVHCCQVWSVVCIHASWKESQHRVSYLVCRRVWIEELASYLDREVWRGTPPTATNTTPPKVHRAAKKSHASCKIVCHVDCVKISEHWVWKVKKQRGCYESRQWEKGQWSVCLEKEDRETAKALVSCMLSKQPQTQVSLTALCTAWTHQINR